eukprot:122939-Pyramimonas_sp.AAC.1
MHGRAACPPAFECRLIQEASNGDQDTANLCTYSFSISVREDLDVGKRTLGVDPVHRGSAPGRRNTCDPGDAASRGLAQPTSWRW